MQFSFFIISFLKIDETMVAGNSKHKVISSKFFAPNLFRNLFNVHSFGRSNKDNPASLRAKSMGNRRDSAVVHSQLSSHREISSPLPAPIIQLIFEALISEGDELSVRNSRLVCKEFDRIACSLFHTGSSISSLPDEILLGIFVAVRFNSSSKDPMSDLASSLRVSKQWYRVGMTVLYRHFVIDVNYQTALIQEDADFSSISRYNFIPSARFFDTTTKLWSQPWTTDGIGSWIHSLSIEIHFEDTERARHMQSITDVIRALPNIRTFSVRAAPLRQHSEIVRHKLSDILLSIPSSVVNFELDLQGRDDQFDPHLRQNTHFCETVGRILPQLRTLRLRLSTLCDSFLLPISRVEEKCPGLKALSITLYTRQFTQLYQCCSDRQWIPPATPATDFVDSLQSRIQNGGIFPNLKACSLICLRHDCSAPNTKSQRVICKTFEPRMKTWSKRAYFPIGGFRQPEYIQTDADGDDLETVMQGMENRTYGFYDLPKERMLTHCKETDVLLESAAAWTEDAFGARYPPNV
ncbi:uncharacterized protein PV09_08197 [Verruconis gallopava]|uniref:F-box domain-containing protein n=1 Tax=Verruconis gallopava TaxID=253628 RepID=A0A0D2A1V6_9PEZI|nr:uncharacterized protein PV09_08197 [Verruconis gallopava]KIW00310.1 hypothetical protein PV09_08197 [Verruconis gallopava]